MLYPPLIFQDHPVGIGTVPHKAVAGLHRAYPSTSLDKSLSNIFIKTAVLMLAIDLFSFLLSIPPKKYLR